MGVLAVDTETSGVDWGSVVRLVQFGTVEGGWAVPVEDEAGRAEVRRVLEEHDGLLVMHNAGFDIHQLSKIGLDPEYLWARTIDTYAIAHVLDSSRRNGLDALVESLLDSEDAGYKKAFRAWMRKNGYTWADVPL